MEDSSANVPRKSSKKLSGYTGRPKLRRSGKSPALQPAIHAMLAAHYDRHRIADILGIDRWAVKEFGTKRFHGGIENQPWHDEVNEALARACMTNAGAAALQVAEMLPEASALQAATVLGIMVDKTQVLRGKTVQTPVATIHLVAVKEVARLEQELRDMELTTIPAPVVRLEAELRVMDEAVVVTARPVGTIGGDDDGSSVVVGNIDITEGPGK